MGNNYDIILIGLVAVFSFTSGWRMAIDEQQALVVAQGAVGFAVGHASAQQVWHGVRSRPTWRVLVYSAEEPPRRRGLVLVDDTHRCLGTATPNPARSIGGASSSAPG